MNKIPWGSTRDWKSHLIDSWRLSNNILMTIRQLTWEEQEKQSKLLIWKESLSFYFQYLWLQCRWIYSSLSEMSNSEQYHFAIYFAYHFEGKFVTGLQPTQIFIPFFWKVRRKNMKSNTGKRKRGTCWHPHWLPGKTDSAAANSNIIPQDCKSGLSHCALHHVGAQMLHRIRPYEQLTKQIPTVNLCRLNRNANACTLTLAARKMSQLNPCSPLFPEPLTNLSLFSSSQLMPTLLHLVLKQQSSSGLQKAL